ncbi:MAG TPA: sigma factor-like helix-turn-helix DNA-binding protein [Candidatus Paceibacterota bacterium]|jgi:hypothetical protein
MVNISFKPKSVTKRLLAVLPERARDVLVHRYGLGNETEPRTLEAIGSTYGITRERVRQIESHALVSIRKSDAFKEESPAFSELQTVIEQLGGVVPEDELMTHLAKDDSTRNHIQFLLVLGDSFTRKKEDAEFHHRWCVDEELAERVQKALKDLYKSLGDEDLVPESDIITRFLEQMQDLNEQYKNEEIARRWLTLSKILGRNPLGEWGIASSPNVRAKGMRDYAYLTIKRHGSPMHFAEVATAIEELFNRKAHVATCHNELIKDPRFVLVGRGLYALAEWGYSTGVVKDVIREILHKHGSLTRDEIVDLVKKERYVKDNTILVNLQDGKVFARDKSGRYTLAT